MDQTDFINASLRLRYEAFSKFATSVSESKNLSKVAEAIAKQLKFIVDTFVLRFTLRLDQTTVSFEMYRGNCTINTAARFSSFEEDRIRKGLPDMLDHSKIQEEETLKGSLFDNSKIEYLLVLPSYSVKQQPIILSIASRSGHPYSEIDFRFARLIEELLTTKISQILLSARITTKNEALKQANKKLSKLNQQVQDLNTKLEAKVEERTYKLKEAHEELHTLLYRTSHDFRRPLTAIMGLAQLLKDCEEAEERTELANGLEVTVNGLDAMLTKLRTLVHSEVKEAPTIINFEDLIEAVSKRFEPELNENAIQLSVSIEIVHEYRSHPLIITALLYNLIENAVQYRQQVNSFISISIREEANLLLIQVEDNGQGIEEHLQPVIFDMYVQANVNSTGNGLGLFVVKKLLNALRGSITVDSVVNQGSTFTVTIPVTKTKETHLDTVAALL